MDISDKALSLLALGAARNKNIRKLKTLAGAAKDVVDKLRAIESNFTGPKPPIQVWPQDPERGGSTLNSVSNRADPGLNFMWEALILEPDLENSASLPAYDIEEISTPSINIEKKDIRRSGVNFSYAGSASFDSISVTLYNGVDGTCADYVGDWIDRIYHKTGRLGTKPRTYGLSSKYKKKIIINLIGPYNIIYTTYVIHGVFPTSWQSLTLGSASQPIGIQLTLSVDDVDVYYPDDATKNKIKPLVQERSNVGVPRMPNPVDKSLVDTAKNLGKKAMNAGSQVTALFTR